MTVADVLVVLGYMILAASLVAILFGEEDE